MAEEGMRTLKAEFPMRGFLLVARWKAAWDERLGTAQTWTEFLTGMASDKAMWPRGKA